MVGGKTYAFCADVEGVVGHAPEAIPDRSVQALQDIYIEEERTKRNLTFAFAQHKEFQRQARPYSEQKRLSQ